MHETSALGWCALELGRQRGRARCANSELSEEPPRAEQRRRRGPAPADRALGPQPGRLAPSRGLGYLSPGLANSQTSVTPAPAVLSGTALARPAFRPALSPFSFQVAETQTETHRTDHLERPHLWGCRAGKMRLPSRRPRGAWGYAWACLGLFRAGLRPSLTAQIGGFGDVARVRKPRPGATGAQGLRTCSPPPPWSSGKTLSLCFCLCESVRRRQELGRIL